MKAETFVKAGAVIAASIAGIIVVRAVYRFGNSASETAGKAIESLGEAAKDVIDAVNPSSENNIVYKAVTSTPAGVSFSQRVGDTLGRIFDPKGFAKMQENLRRYSAAGNTSNLSNQGKAFAPDSNQSAAEVARLTRQENMLESIDNQSAAETARLSRYSKPTTASGIWGD